ncbi:inactive pancreatic lipase-related protein 1-like [Hemiscyllium ocellatum]|uniref:inactive pancreatic lipase-related protein 1-like n=1 Tax=Hemiscyllium ocellatum TaxID=170820 RepID=UPI0029670953|nr:inactive pancreatic lipase-related protein 1-like [Hemiscyllium ocellatum]
MAMTPAASSLFQMLRLLLAFTLLLIQVNAEGICYDRLGCFPSGYPWTGTKERPANKLPWSPEKINTRFLLYTRQNPNNYQELSGTNPETVDASNFDLDQKSVFIMHGYLENGDVSWAVDLCKTILRVDDVNCICVDWRGGSQCSYSQAAQNIRVVGTEIAYFLDTLESHYNYTISNVYLVGHSLGAHAAGEAGKRAPGIPRITGLDPVEPYFQNTPPEVRLDPTDAFFVDVIHTDGSSQFPSIGFGMIQACGHMDFYPNGGENMPGCSKNILSTILDIDGIWQGTKNFLSCNHFRAVRYFSESVVSPDGFLAFPCGSEKEFQAEECFACPTEGCPTMGYTIGPYRPAPGLLHQTFYLRTGESSPYGVWRYNVSVTLSGSHSVSGILNVALYGSKGNTRQHQITKTKLHPGKTYWALIDAEHDVGDVTKVKFLWNNNVINIFQPKLGAESITLVRAKDHTSFRFCGNEMVKEETLQTLTPCTS